MKKITTFLMLFLCLGSIKAQNQNSIWSIPPSYYKVDNTLQPLPIPNLTTAPYGGYTGLASQTCSNAINDAQENLLFFVLNSSLYDALGREIGQMITQIMA